MTYHPDRHHRRSIRLQGYDYVQAGAYFVTICVSDRGCVFGEVVDTEMQLSAAGMVVHACWDELSDHYRHIELDAFVVMPNHVHGIICLTTVPAVGARFPRPYTLGQITAYFKYQSTKRLNEIHGTPGVPVWQRNYYEHIIRNEHDLYEIRRYIEENPFRWQLDPENPARKSQ